MNKLEDVQNWRGMKVVDADGDKIGTIEDVFLDRHTGEPEWATVKTGLFGLKSTFVPIREAQVTGDDQVRVPFQKDQAKNAPRIDADGKLSPEQERELWEYYGRFDYDECRARTARRDWICPTIAQATSSARLRPMLATMPRRRSRECGCDA